MFCKPKSFVPLRLLHSAFMMSFYAQVEEKLFRLKCLCFRDTKKKETSNRESAN